MIKLLGLLITKFLCDFFVISKFRLTMAAAVAQGVESRIRTLAQTKRIRIKDYFQDFDKLKGGAVTGRKYILIFITI